MKNLILPYSRAKASSQARSGFTLSEIIISTALFSLVVLSLVYTHLFTLRLFNITATRLSACQGSRAALNLVCQDIRSAKLLNVGSGDSTGFTNTPLNSPRQGNALEIVPSGGSNQLIRYFMDPHAQALKRFDNLSGNTRIVAPFITNQIAFYAEDYSGGILTNDQNNRIIRVDLQFYQWEFPVAQVGAYYDSYRLQTRIARRTIE